MAMVKDVTIPCTERARKEPSRWKVDFIIWRMDRARLRRGAGARTDGDTELLVGVMSRPAEASERLGRFCICFLVEAMATKNE